MTCMRRLDVVYVRVRRDYAGHTRCDLYHDVSFKQWSNRPTTVRKNAIVRHTVLGCTQRHLAKHCLGQQRLCTNGHCATYETGMCHPHWLRARAAPSAQTRPGTMFAQMKARPRARSSGHRQNGIAKLIIVELDCKTRVPDRCHSDN